MNKKVIIGLTVFVFSFFVLGCASTDHNRSERYGTATGAAVGGVTGAIVGHNWGDGNTKDRATGAMIGTMAGAMVGNHLGQSQDHTRNRIEALERQSSTTFITINNSNGSMTQVPLVHSGNGTYRGPRGEIYVGLPSQEQLKPVYGF